MKRVITSYSIHYTKLYDQAGQRDLDGLALRLHADDHQIGTVMQVAEHLEHAPQGRHLRLHVRQRILRHGANQRLDQALGAGQLLQVHVQGLERFQLRQQGLIPFQLLIEASPAGIASYNFV